jgi:hypothetical protein
MRRFATHACWVSPEGPRDAGLRRFAGRYARIACAGVARAGRVGYSRLELRPPVVRASPAEGGLSSDNSAKG